MKRLLIVEDHAIVRQGVIRILQDVLDPSVEFHEASDGQQAVKMVNSGEYDLVLLDISLPDLNGLNVLKLLNQKAPKLPVIMLSTHPEEQYAVRALRAGAAGYVNKGSEAAILKEAIEKVLTGRRYVTSSQSDLLVDAISDKRDSMPMPETLSDREYQMACMITAGKALTEIAGDLSLSVKTIGTYRARILKKLHLKTTADIINYSIQHKLTL